MKKITVIRQVTPYKRTATIKFENGYAAMFVEQREHNGRRRKCELVWNQSDFSFWQADAVGACIALLTKAHEVMVEWDADRGRSE